MANFCFVRHGQTDWNIDGRWQGFADTELNKTGNEQAQAAADLLKDHKFDAAYSSDLKRAYNTAQYINQHHQLSLVSEKRLREQNLGKWEGLYVKKVPELFPEEWQAFLDDPINAVLGGGESLRDLTDRVMDVMTELVQKHNEDENILLVAHGLTLAVLTCLLTNQPLTETYKNIPANATPFFYEITKDTIKNIVMN